jgi:hypothetical protein
MRMVECLDRPKSSCFFLPFFIGPNSFRVILRIITLQDFKLFERDLGASLARWDL